MKKRALIDLTPLLDVILLLLFAFIIVLQGTSDLQAEELDDETSRRIEAEQTADTLSSDVAELQAQVDMLLQESVEDDAEIGRLKGLLDTQVIANDDEKQSLEMAVDAFQQMTVLNKDQLDALLENQSNPAKLLSDMVDAGDMVLELYKYAFVMNRFYFLDIELVGANNRVIINGADTHIIIGADDNIDSTSRHDKAIVIYDELQEHISTRSGGDEMVMAILIVRDADVYQFAYEIAWEALRELELRASGYRFYKTSYTYLE